MGGEYLDLAAELVRGAPDQYLPSSLAGFRVPRFPARLHPDPTVTGAQQLRAVVLLPAQTLAGRPGLPAKLGLASRARDGQFQPQCHVLAHMLQHLGIATVEIIDEGEEEEIAQG